MEGKQASKIRRVLGTTNVLGPRLVGGESDNSGTVLNYWIKQAVL